MNTNNKNLVEVNFQPYKKKSYFFSVAELRFYETLRGIIGDNYFIYPKVRMCDIIEATGKDKFFNFNRIKSKHVDFLICTKSPIISNIVIELDDKSHDAPKRQARDSFVDEIFANAGIPIVHVKAQSFYNKEEVTRQLQKAYETSYIIKKELEEDLEKKPNKSPGCSGIFIILILLIICII